MCTTLARALAAQRGLVHQSRKEVAGLRATEHPERAAFVEPDDLFEAQSVDTQPPADACLREAGT